MSRQALPIDAHLQAICDAAKSCPRVLVKAEPGAGKTTRLPIALADALPGRILVLEPRRLAARLSAERVAEELGSACGQEVGYIIRHDRKVSEATRVCYVTEAVFLRLMLEDPRLSRYAGVVLDEFHERHIYSDQALALGLRLQQEERLDLRLVLMSATLDTSRLESFLKSPQVFDVPGRVFPVNIRYRGTVHDKPDQHLLGACQEVLAETNGDVLVFLAGRQEIARARTELQPHIQGVEILPLTADMQQTDVARVFGKGGPRRVILATNVAETSLTLPNVTGVVDSGLAKQASYAPWSGMPTLDLKKVSQASCVQRAGRAGRTAAGLCVRLFSEDDFLQRPAFTTPEISRVDLSQLVVEVLALEKALQRPQGDIAAILPWLDAPDPKHLEAAVKTLRYLGALNEANELTDIGDACGCFPLHPRLSAVVVAAHRQDAPSLGCWVAALIHEGMLLRTSARAFDKRPCDVTYQLDLVRGELVGHDGDVAAGLRSLIVPGRVRAILRTAERLAKIQGCALEPIPKDLQSAIVARMLLGGFPDRVALRRSGPEQLKSGRTKAPVYNFCLGRGGRLSEGSVVHNSELIVAIDATESLGGDAASGTVVRVASTLQPTDLHSSHGSLLSEGEEVRWNDRLEKVELERVLRYGNLSFSKRIDGDLVEAIDAESCQEILRSELVRRWPGPFLHDPGIVVYHRKRDLLSKCNVAHDLPEFVGEMFELFVDCLVEGKRSFAELSNLELKTELEQQLSFEQRQFLREWLPDVLHLANGKQLVIHYAQDQDPFVQGFVQDFFGLKQAPRLANGRIPLTFKLLGPNKRPVQVTSDLDGFWKRGYAPLKQELLRRYPRHHWPEDPVAAPPILHKNRL